MHRTLFRFCPFCHADNTKRKRVPFGPKRWPLKTCGACGFTYLERAAAYVELEENFAWEKTSKNETARRTAAEPVVAIASAAVKEFRSKTLKRDKLASLISEFIPQGGTVIDIGCANGRTLKSLAGRYHVAGVEISKALAAKARKNVPSAKVVQADAVLGLRQFEGKSCAGVIMSSFLEHEIEPRLLLAETLRVLRPGDGVAIIKVPNYACLNRRIRGKKWCGFRFPDHVNYFTPVTIVAMIRAAGFEVRRFRFRDCHPFSDNLWIVISPATPHRHGPERQPCSQPEFSEELRDDS